MDERTEAWTPEQRRLVLRGRRANVVNLIMAVAGAGLMIYFAIAFRKPILLVLVAVFLASVAAAARSFFQPPCIEISGDRFAIRSGSRRIETPISNISSISLAAGSLRIAVRDFQLVEPVEIAARIQKDSSELVLPGDAFSTEQFHQLRTALGMREAADAEVLEIREFAEILHTLTPKLFVTKSLIAINAGVFVVMALSGVHPLQPEIQPVVQWGANFGRLSLTTDPWRLVTSTAIHWGVIHLAFNMWVLWNIGQVVERLMGNTGFFLVYLLAGLFGSVASLVWNPFVISAGASGAVFGVFGGLLAFLLRRRNSVPVMAMKSLWSSGMMFVVLNIILGSTIPAIDNAAHIGGLLAGFVFGYVLCRPLAPEPLFRRSSRYLLVASAGLMLLVAGYQLLPRQAMLHLNSLAETHNRMVATYNAARDQFEQGVKSGEEFAATVRADIGDPWAVQLDSILTLRFLYPPYRTYLERGQRMIGVVTAAIDDGNAQRREAGFRAFEALGPQLKQLERIYLRLEPPG